MKDRVRHWYRGCGLATLPSGHDIVHQDELARDFGRTRWQLPPAAIVERAA
jgi:hypothetical protein